MTRHHGLRRHLGAAAAAFALLSLAACGGGGDDGKDEGDGKDTTRGTGFDAALTKAVNPSDAKGGTLRFVSTQDSDSWDPQRGYYGFMWDFSRFYTRQLVTYATEPGPAGLEIVPDLATSRAKITNGGKTYTYTLREGVTYEDGSPVKAQDVKYGIERIFATDVVSGGPPYLMQVLDAGQKYPGPYKDTAADKLGLRSVVTPDDRTIVFNLPSPNSDFEAMLAMPSGTPVPPARDKGSKYGLRPFSSGPYKFESYDPNKSLVLVRNDKWDKASDPVRPALPDRIEVEFSTNANDADAKTLNGTYDINLAQRGLQQAARAKVLTDAKYKPHADNPSTGFIRYVAMPQTVEPFDDIECRKAVIYAADKKALQAARGGPSGGDIGTNMLPPNIKGADPDWDPWGTRTDGGAPQTDKAKAALKACGKPDGFSTKIAVRQNEPAEIASAEALQESLGKVGIKTQIEKFDGSQGNAIIGAPTNVDKQGYGLIVYGWGADFQSGAGYLQPLVDSRYISQNGNNNYTMTRDPSIDALFDKAAAETAPDKAAAYSTEINKKVTESAVYLPFVFDKTVNYRGERLTNVYYSDAYGKVDFVSLGVKGGS